MHSRLLAVDFGFQKQCLVEKMFGHVLFHSDHSKTCMDKLKIPRPEGFAQPYHRAWVLFLYWRKCVHANLLCCGKSCRLLLVHYMCVSRTSPWNGLCPDVVCLRCRKNCQNYTRILLEIIKMLLEVAPEVHEEPLAPKMSRG